MAKKLIGCVRLVKFWFLTRVAILLIGSSKSGLKCGGWCKLSKNTHVGTNVSFNGMRVFGRGRVELGDNFHSGSGCEILTENHNYEGERIPYDNTYDIRDVKIGDNVWLGNKVTILPGVTIGEGVIIQACSVVVSDIPSCSIAGGHPARVFSKRSEEHYFRLKREGRYH